MFGFSQAQASGWGSPVTLACVVAGAVLLVVFILVENRVASPLLPLRVVFEKVRGGSLLGITLGGMGTLSVWLFLTYYFQQVLGYSAIKAGFAFLPFSAGIVAGAMLSSQLLPRIGPRPLMTSGFLLAAAGLVLFTQVGAHSGYVAHLLPAEIMVSLGMGTAFVPLSSTALIGIEPSDAGVASALVNTTQQTGGALGVALLNTVAASATSGYLVSHHGGQSLFAAAAVHGYTTAFGISAALLAGAAAVSVLLLRAQQSDLPNELDLIPA